MDSQPSYFYKSMRLFSTTTVIEHNSAKKATPKKKQRTCRVMHLSQAHAQWPLSCERLVQKQWARRPRSNREHKPMTLYRRQTTSTAESIVRQRGGTRHAHRVPCTHMDMDDIINVCVCVCVCVCVYVCVCVWLCYTWKYMNHRKLKEPLSITGRK